MKKAGFLILILAINIISFYFVDAATSDILFGITSWRADNISGWACDPVTHEPVNLELVIRDKNNNNIGNPHLITMNMPSPQTILTTCGGTPKNFNFKIDLFKNLSAIELTNTISSSFPLSAYIYVPEDQTKNDLKVINFSCIYPNQTILKLANKGTNAHIYLGNQSTFSNSYPICYERVFGYPYEGSSQIYPTTCTSPILYKNQLENTHAAKTQITGYTNKLCYADLQCTPRVLSCNSGEKPVVSLFYSNNSHASDSINPDYLIKMCCTTGYIPNPIRETSWYNMLGQQISSADKCDWVQIGAWGTDLANQQVTFNIKNSAKDTLFTQDMLIPLYNSPQIAWQTNNGDTLNFEAIVSLNHNLNKTSNSLVVSNEIASSDYNIVLTTPKCGDNFTINNNINFNIFMNTTKSLINGKISFGDGTNSTFSNQGTNTAVFTHQYSTDGTKTVTIETRPAPVQSTNCPDLSYLLKRKIINIIVIDPAKSGEYIASCIDSPEDLSKIPQQTVFCNASSTKAISYSNTAGYTKIPHTSLSFKWTFSDNTIHEFWSILNNTHIPPCYDTVHDYINPSGEKYTHTISCDTTTTGTAFTKYFQSAGDHSANLIVNKTG